MHITSGRELVVSVTARSLANKLIADGVLEKPIARMYADTGYVGILYFERSGYYSQASTYWCKKNVKDETLWQPSFIEPEVWEQATQAFRPNSDLKYNVERHLLPLMPDYNGGKSDEEVVRDFLLENGVLNTPIRQVGGDTFYFNGEEIYTLDKGSQIFAYGRFHVFRIADFDGRVWTKAATRFQPGMKLIDCVRIFLDTVLNTKPERGYSFIDRLIQRVEEPEYERVPENENGETFDRIRVFVGLPRYMFSSWDELKKAVLENRKEIDQRVLDKIENDRHFKKYKVPVNYLKLTEVLLRRSCSLEYIFELKLVDTGETCD